MRGERRKQPAEPQGLEAASNRHSGLRIAFLYLVLAILWIVASDLLWAALFVEDLGLGTAAQIAKGLLFVTVSAVVVGWLVHREVEKVQAVRAELERKEESLTGIFEAHPLPLFVYDVETLRFLDVNTAALQFYGYSRGAFLEMSIDEIRPDEDLPRLRESLEDTREYQRSGVWRHKRGDGAVVWVEVYSHSIRYSDREARLVAAVDVTARREARANLVQALEAAALADQAKSNILSSVSHELRSPLHAILGLSQLLLEDWSGDEAKEDIRAIYDEAKAMSEKVNRLIEAARLTSTPGAVEQSVFDLHALCKDVSALYASLSEAKGLRFEFAFADEVERKVDGAPATVRKILLNLLSNAVKFTNEGYVRLQVMPDEDGGDICISVEDSGIGVADGVRRWIFEAFTQVESGFARRYPGAGLGLYLAKGHARKIGAELELDWSEPGRGSRFILRLPGAHREALPAESAASARS